MATPIPENLAPFSFAEIESITGADPTATDGDTVGVAIDSRAVKAGSLFVAVRGERIDGAEYVEQAIAAGAAAVMVHVAVETPTGVPCFVVADTTRALGALASFHRERWGRKVVAITGSAGKTTTKELAAAALAQTGAVVLKTEGNLNNQFGVPMTVLTLTGEHDIAVLELGTSSPGEIATLRDIVKPNVAAVTLAAIAHAEGLGSLQDVAKEKASIWATLGDEGVAVVNADDHPLVSALAFHSPRRVWSFGRSPTCDVQLVESGATLEGTAMSLSVRGSEPIDTTLGLLGEPAAIDAACAVACAAALLGEAVARAAIEGLGQVTPSEGRMRPIAAPGGIQIIDDTYNANPESTALGLSTLMEIVEERGGKSIAVLGDMLELGVLSDEAHEQIGERAVELGVSVLIGVGPGMAKATAAAMRAAAAARPPMPTRVLHLTEAADAVRMIRSLVNDGDVIFVKGSRSMRMERIVEGLLSEKTP